jgi:integral membrane protein (TIGR01906 family)
VRILLSLATAITILAVALVLLLTPIWTHFAIAGAGSQAPAGGLQQAFDASDRTVLALVTLGRFDFLLPGRVMFAPDEQAHMRDVQVVLYAFLILAIASLAFVIVTLRRSPTDLTRWRAVARGAWGLMLGLIVVGVFAAVAFERVFLLFHEIFFPGGNFSFAEDSYLILLYPERFWEQSALALFVFAMVGAAIVREFGRRRAAALSRA